MLCTQGLQKKGKQQARQEAVSVTADMAGKWNQTLPSSEKESCHREWAILIQLWLQQLGEKFNAQELQQACKEKEKKKNVCSLS